jgi:hypothetical protein
MSATDTALLFVAGGLLVVASAARADVPQVAPSASQAPTPDTAAAAQALFVEGRHLVIDGRYAEGCAKLEESARLDPAPGTQINLADCYEKSGKIASAWLAFHEASAAAQRSGRVDWAEQARERARVLEPSVPRLTVVVDEPVAGLVVRRSGVAIDPSTLGSPVPIDPGAYEVVAAAPTRRAWSTRVVVDASTRVVLHVPALAEEPPPTLVPTVAHEPIAHRRSAQRTIALGVGAIAVVPLALGSYFGVRAITHNDTAAALCPTSPNCLDPHAVQLTGEAHRDATAANASFITGGVLLATAAVLFFTAPKEAARPGLAIGVAGTTASLLGRW